MAHFYRKFLFPLSYGDTLPLKTNRHFPMSPFLWVIYKQLRDDIRFSLECKIDPPSFIRLRTY